MAGFPNSVAPTPDFYSSYGESIGLWSTGASTTNVWPAVNRAIFVPFRVYSPVTAYKMVMGVGTTGNNIDVGIYDSQGNRLVSMGSTAVGTGSAEQIFDIADTRLDTGLYYMAASKDATTGMFSYLPSVQVCRLAGIVKMDTAFALPATATFAATGDAYLPAISVYTRGL